MSYELLKTDSGEHFLIGVMLVPDLPDTTGDIVSESEIAKCIARYNAGRKKVMKNHETPFSASDVEVSESYQSLVDFSLNGKTVKRGSWIVKFRISQSVYEQARQGKVVGFSVGGRAKEE